MQLTVFEHQELNVGLRILVSNANNQNANFLLENLDRIWTLVMFVGNQIMR